MDRRNFCKNGVGLSISGLFYGMFNNAFAKEEDIPTIFGETSGILDLPTGFSYTILDRRGEQMSDGYLVPGAPDGMACFTAPNGNLVLMRNHELNADDVAIGPFQAKQTPPVESYDRAELGGVSRLVLDPVSMEKLSSNLVLTGSARNCAGGISPWGWLTCEETVEKDHGYVFLCDPSAESVKPAKRIPSYGRFNHEAAAVHPQSLYAYLTEDRSDGCFYRFVPNDSAKPFEGDLQALKVKGRPQFDTGNKMAVGDSLAVEWVSILNPDTNRDDVREQAQAKGAARVKRGEGLWIFGDHVYFSATTGGPIDKGQIFRLDLDAHGEDKLNLVAHASDTKAMDMPDNITVDPQGRLFFAEDGTGDQFVRMVTTDGRIKDFARNRKSSSEITGVCFAPDGQTMFLNLQTDGMTLAIRGPFASWG